MRLYVTGRLCVEWGDAAIHEDDLPGPQAVLLFGMLGINAGQITSRDEIADALWPRGLPKTWESNIRAVVARLRATLRGLDDSVASAVVAQGHGYRLALGDGDWVDFHEAIGSLHRAEAALLSGKPQAAAASAWVAEAIARRDLLPSVEGTWLETHRRRLETVRLRALDCLAGALCEVGENADAVRHADLALSLDPFRESSHRRLIEVYGRSEDRGSAARAFHACETLLVGELGVAPSPSTRAAYERAVGLALD